MVFLLRRPYLTGALLLVTGLLRIYISSLDRIFLFSTLNIAAIALVLIGVGFWLIGTGRLLTLALRYLWTSWAAKL